MLFTSLSYFFAIWLFGADVIFINIFPSLLLDQIIGQFSLSCGTEEFKLLSIPPFKCIVSVWFHFLCLNVIQIKLILMWKMDPILFISIWPFSYSNTICYEVFLHFQYILKGIIYNVIILNWLYIIKVAILKSFSRFKVVKKKNLLPLSSPYVTWK